MVNPGKPSTGCYTCRKRRIKCDERKPTCQQCEKSRRTCGGYRTNADMMFRNENEVAKKNAYIQTLDRAKVRDLEEQTLMVDRIPRFTIQIDPEELVVNHFFRFAQIKDVSVLKIAQDLRQAASSTSPLIPITTSLAWVNAPPLDSTRDFFKKARNKYAEAVVKLQKSLQDPFAADVNETLLAILMLGMSEVALGPPIEIGVGALSHLRGAVGFIEAVQKLGRADEFHPAIIAVLMTHLLLGWIISPLPLAIQMHVIFRSFKESTGASLRIPKESALLTQLGVSAAETHTQVRLYRATNWAGVDKTDLERLQRRYRHVASQIWEFVPPWLPDRPPEPTTDPEIPGFTHIWNHCRTPQAVNPWLRRDFSSLCLYKLLLCVSQRRTLRQMIHISRISGVVDSEIDALQAEDRTIQLETEKVVREILEGLPSFIEADITDFPPEHTGENIWRRASSRIGAYSLIMPLRAANSVPDLPEHLRAEIWKAARYITHLTGIEADFIRKRLDANVFEDVEYPMLATPCSTKMATLDFVGDSGDRDLIVPSLKLLPERSYLAPAISDMATYKDDFDRDMAVGGERLADTKLSSLMGKNGNVCRWGYEAVINGVD